ncbi:MAG: T9SS type A sorting domain-containing protein [Candidatus Azobacteroides sp.]|nr:T9SS type A sorting domain-containing protein [Candidatus Azobacteroides sp.]
MKTNLLKRSFSLILGLLVSIPFLTAQIQYCDTPVTSSDGSKTINMSCQSLGGGEYEIKLESDENISNVPLANVGININGVGGTALTFTADPDNNNIIRSTFTAPDGVGDMYVGVLFIIYEGAGEKQFNIQQPDIDWTVTCGDAPVYDVNLATLTVDGVSVPNFVGARTSYDIELPYGTTTVPTVAATTSNSEYTPVITQAASLPGTATVVVTATEDASVSKTYTINFTVSMVDPGKNDECSGVDNEVSEGTPYNYSYNFETTDEGVVVVVELLESVTGLIAFMHDVTTGFLETGMAQIEGTNAFTTVLPYTTNGQQITFRVKFAYAGGLTTTRDFVYTVGKVCLSTDISSPSVAVDVDAYSKDNTIFIENVTAGDQVSIYDINGKLVNATVAQNEVVAVSLEKGLYIVKVAGANGTVALKVLN